ncbi:MAG TPA: hypothetical protein VFL34_02945 [Candidatus Sulfotelmatobacter sp.]|nr:hypothetical protein [Candidatus Sulfotelmatobacter sp.]
MASELKVYNRFGELTLHVRLSVENGPELTTIDGTREMRAAIAGFKGSDFDRTVIKENELHRLTSNWGSPAYLNVLGRYFVANFGWDTTIVEADESSTASTWTTASGNVFSYGVVLQPRLTNTVVTVNINADSPEFRATATDLPTASKKASSANEVVLV